MSQKNANSPQELKNNLHLFNNKHIWLYGMHIYIVKYSKYNNYQPLKLIKITNCYF
jgi:hypothetical protein